MDLVPRALPKALSASTSTSVIMSTKEPEATQPVSKISFLFPVFEKGFGCWAQGAAAGCGSGVFLGMTKRGGVCTV